MNFGSSGTIVVETLTNVRSCSNLGIRTGNTHQSAVSNTLNRRIQERHHRPVGIQVHYIELDVFFTVNQQQVRIFHRLLVFCRI